MPDVVVILGSARSPGLTTEAVGRIFCNRPCEIVDLNRRRVLPYDYADRHDDDDFIPIVERLAEADVIVLATPVYWYTMSAVLKNFFDRFTDLLNHRRDLLKRLKAKPVYLIVSGADKALPEAFEVPIRRTCEYLRLQFRETFYYCTFHNPREAAGRDRDAAARLFGDRLLQEPPPAPPNWGP